MEKPRPSPNFGKFTSMRAASLIFSVKTERSSCGSSRSTSASGSEGGFATTRRSLISVAIDSRFKWFDANAMDEVDEALDLAVACVQVELDQFLDHVGHFGARKRRAEHFAERGAGPRRMRITLVSADLDLVPLLAVLIDAEDADVADVVMAAGVHAA